MNYENGFHYLQIMEQFNMINNFSYPVYIFLPIFFQKGLFMWQKKSTRTTLGEYYGHSENHSTA